MARETKRLQIGDCTYYIKHLAAKEQRKVMLCIMKAASPLAAYSGTSVDPSLLISEIVSSVTSEDLDVMTECFADCTLMHTQSTEKAKTDPVPLSGCIDEHFAGTNMVHWMTWLRECVQHNYAGFFGELRKQMADVLGEAEGENASEFQST